MIVLYSWSTRNPGSSLVGAFGFDSGERAFEGSALLSTGGGEKGGKAAARRGGGNNFATL